MKHRFILSLALWCGLWTVVWAGNDSEETSRINPKSLSDLLQIYRSHSPEIKAQAEKQILLQNQALGAKAYPAPEIGVEFGQKGMYYTGLMVSQEFMYPGKIKAMQRMEAAKVAMGSAEFQANERRGSVQIARLVMDQYMMQEKIRIMDSSLTLLESLLQSTRRRFEAGASSMAGMAGGGAGMESVYRLQAEINRLRIDRTAFFGSQKSMQWMLAAAVGLDSLPLMHWSVEDRNAPLPHVDSLLTMVHKKPEILAMQKDINMAQAELQAAKLMNMPDFMVQAKYMMMKEVDWSLMVGVRLPIAPWSAKQSESSVKSASSKERMIQAQIQSMLLMQQQEIREAWVQVENAKEKWLGIQNSQIPAVLESLKALSTAYGNGKADLSAWLDALRMSLMAQDDAIMSQVEYYMALLQLENAAGVETGMWLPQWVAQGVTP